jgi:Major tropism determinant N-terminal domain
MSVTIQLRGDTAANWAAANPIVPKAREVCVETDTNKAKFGDGVTTYADLPYWTLGALDVQSVFGRTGPVSAQSGDYTAAQVGALALAGGNMLGWLGPKEVTLSQSGGNVAISAQAGNSFVLPLTSSGWTIQTPTNPSPGQKIEIAIAQDPTGGRTVAWASGWNFGESSAPTLTTTPEAIDVLVFKYIALLGAWCYIGLAPGFSPPPQNIAFIDSVASTFGQGVGNGVPLVLPGDLAVGDAVIVGVISQGNSNVVPTSISAATTGASTPVPLGTLLTGIFGTGSQLFGFLVQPGDLSVANGGSAGSNATLTFTGAGSATGYGTAAGLAAYSGAVLPPGAIGRSTSVSGSNTYVAPTTTTVAAGGWEVEFLMTGSGLSTTFPGSLTARTPISVAVCIADGNAPVAADTVIGGETWGSNAGSVAFHAHTIALDAA